jgi:YVTN family beta-propeller protein
MKTTTLLGEPVWATRLSLLRRWLWIHRATFVAASVLWLASSMAPTTLGKNIRSTARGRPSVANASSAFASAFKSPAGRTTPRSLIQIKYWTHPERGWLYVLDSNNGADTSQILVVDPDQPRVVDTIRTDYNPDMTLSADGSRLYVVSGAPALLYVIDTMDGRVIGTAGVPERETYISIPSFSSMAVSGDGNVLYLLKARLTGSGEDQPDYSVAMFDVRLGGFLPEEFALPSCGAGRFVPMPGQTQFWVHCTESNDLRSLPQASGPRATVEPRLDLPWGPRHLPGPTPGAPKILVPPAFRHTVYTFFYPDAQTVLAVMGNEEIFELDSQSGQTWTTAARGRTDRCVPSGIWPRSPDGARLYLGSASLDDHARMLGSNEIHAFDTHTWQHVATVKTKGRFWSLTLSKDGSTLYAISPERSSIYVIDAATYQNLRTIKDIGSTPALALVVP